MARRNRGLTDLQNKWLFRFNERGALVVEGASRRYWKTSTLGSADTPTLGTTQKLVSDGLLEMKGLGHYEISALGKEKLAAYYAN